MSSVAINRRATCSRKIQFDYGSALTADVDGRVKMSQLFARERQVTEKCVLLSVYFALLLDNLLLTAVVPILPHFVHQGNAMQETNGTLDIGFQSGNETLTKSGLYNLLKSSAEHFHIGRGYQPEVGDNSRLGFLLSLKAIVQLVANPLVAIVIQKKGFALPLLVGTINLILCSLLFAFGRSYEVLSSARALQGITSACFTIAGLGLVASTYSGETKRSEAIGRALGGGAVGVLLGYPTAAFLYHITGKTVPFLLVTSLAIMLLIAFSFALRFVICQQQRIEEELIEENICFSSDNFPSKRPVTPCIPQYGNHRNLILAVVIGAIFLTTSVMSLLEPCLPLWLMKTMTPERWQLGAVFIPDSCGYLLTTHFLGGLAYRIGRWRVAMVSMIILGVSCTLVPLASSIIYLTGPHFGIGVGIGAVDASLVPLLATLADRHLSTGITDDLPTPPSYGRTFALGQTAVSLAYCLGPILGGVLVESLGFPRLMVCIGVLNLLFSPLILILKPDESSKVSELTALNLFSGSHKGYSRFENEEIENAEDKR